MRSQAVAIFSVVLVIFYGKGNGAEACCSTLTLPAGLSFTSAPIDGAQGEQIVVACDLGYVATGGSSSGQCDSNCMWSWDNGNSEMLQCTKGCRPPSLTQGVEYVIGEENTYYSIGSTVSLKCSMSYGVKAGSTTGTCDGKTFLWTWEAGKQLECDPACDAPTFTTGVEFASGRLPEYTLGDVITLKCSTGYTSTGGSISATCTSSNTWQWSGQEMLQCSKGCLAPSLTQGVEYVIGNENTYYTIGSTVSLKCSMSYGVKVGSTTGTCDGTTFLWTWETGKQLECDPGCLAPSLTQGVEYVIGNENTYYSIGSTVSLKCSMSYGVKVGSTTGTCDGTTFLWAWETGKQLECDPACDAPIFTTGVEFASGRLPEYTLGNVITLKCSTGYTSTGGSISATCTSGNTWQWSGQEMLQCSKGCLAPRLTQGVEYVNGDENTYYSIGSTVSLKCSMSYGVKDGSTSGTCDGTTFLWTWETGKQLECDPACSAPNLTPGVEYVSGNSASAYLKGSIVSLKCSTQYKYKSGSYNANCDDTLTWIWEAGTQLECDPVCPPPNLPIGTEFASGSLLEYTLNDVIVLRCSNGYASASGGASAICLSSNTWQWNGTGMLQCLSVCSLPTLPTGVQLLSSPMATYLFGSKITAGCISNYGYFSGSYEATCGNNNTWNWTSIGPLQCSPACQPPAVGVKATISPSFTKNTYLLNDTIQFECVGGYVPLSGSETGVCSSMNTWTWLAGTTTSLSCVIAPPYKERVSSTFKPSTCQSYVPRSAPTSSTCLISCLNDGYCRGYAFDGGVCYVDRPFIEATMGSSMACMSR